MHLQGDGRGIVCLGEATVMAQDFQEWEIGRRGPIGDTAPLQVGEAPVRQAATKFSEKPRLANAGFPHNAHDLSLAVFDLRQPLVQRRKDASSANEWTQGMPEVVRQR